jgi:hypothetical protein
MSEENQDKVQDSVTDGTPKNNGNGPVAAPVEEITEAYLLKELRTLKANQQALIYLAGVGIGLLLLIYVQARLKS